MKHVEGLCFTTQSLNYSKAFIGYEKRGNGNNTGIVYYISNNEIFLESEFTIKDRTVEEFDLFENVDILSNLCARACEVFGICGHPVVVLPLRDTRTHEYFICDMIDGNTIYLIFDYTKSINSNDTITTEEYEPEVAEFDYDEFDESSDRWDEIVDQDLAMQIKEEYDG